MKKLFLIGLMALVGGVNISAQDGRTAPGDLGHPCPVGMCVSSATLVFDVFNFHKPRTDCKREFGFCIRTHWEYTCGFPPNCLGGVNTGYRLETKIENGKVTGWFNINPGKVEIHLPHALESAPTFTGVDFKVFHVDADMIFLRNDKGVVTGKLKGGAYPVKRTAQDYTIIVDLE